MQMLHGVEPSPLLLRPLNDLAGETEVLGENQPYYRFVHQKSHIT
jgi:hypothetical protein